MPGFSAPDDATSPAVEAPTSPIQSYDVFPATNPAQGLTEVDGITESACVLISPLFSSSTDDAVPISLEPQNLRDKQHGVVPPGVPPFHSPLRTPSTDDAALASLEPHNLQDERDRIVPPALTPDIGAETMMVCELVEESKTPTLIATPRPTTTILLPVALPVPSPVTPTTSTEESSIDHATLIDDHSGGRASYPASGDEGSNPDLETLVSNDEVVVSESVTSQKAETSIATVDGDTLTEHKERVSKEEEPLTLASLLPPAFDKSPRPTTTTSDSVLDDSTQGDPSPPLPAKEEPIELTPAAEFYHIDALCWEHFASVSAPGSKLSNWVNEHYERGSTPNQHPRCDGDGQAGKLEPQHPSVLLHEWEYFIRAGAIGIGMNKSFRKYKNSRPLFKHSKYPPKRPLAPFSKTSVHYLGVRTGDVGREMNESSGQYENSRISLFGHSKYPPPWPLVPFSHKESQYLEHYIPHRFLPRSLVVHDPWNMLAVNSYNDHGLAQQLPCREWMEQRDIVHEYELKLLSAPQTQDAVDGAGGASRANKDEVPLTEVPRMKAATPPPIDGGADPAVVFTVKDAMDSPSGYLFFHNDVLPGPTFPPIFLTFDLPPHEPLPLGQESQAVDKAHLYIHANNFISSGHHSSVFDVELELPRSSIIYPEKMHYRPKLCITCIKNDLQAELASLDGEHGERMDERWKEKSAEIGHMFVPDEGGDTKSRKRILGIRGSVRHVRIRLRMHDHNAIQCEYANPPPPSTKVHLVAKLSNINDTHLDREAENYQAFPQYMFEHSSNTYTLPNGTNAGPMGAIVPQFYGYYSPKRKHTFQRKGFYQQHGQYLSRILLLEHSGRQIKVDNLTLEEKKQCASLVSRLHDAGWAHESIFERNFLWKPGPINVQHSTRVGEKIFRLVDFGRSYHGASGFESSVGYESWEESCTEDRDDAEELFGVCLSVASAE